MKREKSVKAIGDRLAYIPASHDPLDRSRSPFEVRGAKIEKIEVEAAQNREEPRLKRRGCGGKV